MRKGLKKCPIKNIIVNEAEYCNGYDCKTCPTLNPIKSSKSDHTFKSPPKKSNKLNRKFLTRVFQMQTQGLPPLFNRLEYKTLLVAVAHNETFGFEWWLKEKFNKIQKRKEMAVLVDKAIKTDLEILRMTIDLVKQEIQERKKEPKRYSEFAGWVVYHWGE